jgi:hypothetical protein
VIVERESHSSKQRKDIVSTDEGIQIVESEEQLQNAAISIHRSLESASNAIVARESHS